MLWISSRFVWMFVTLVLVLLVLPTLTITTWVLRSRQIHHAVEVVSKVSEEAHLELLREVTDSARSLFPPIRLSATNLAKVVNSSVTGSISSFSDVKNQVEESLFLVYRTIPYLSQISYIGENGLFFSYYKEENHTAVLFANTSYSSTGSNSNDSTIYRWYSQRVNDDTGIQYGEAIDSDPQILVNASWFSKALNSKDGYASLGLGWGRTQESLFLSMAPVKDHFPQGERGVISLGVPAEVLADFVTTINLHGGDLHLATEDGHVLAQTGNFYTSVVTSDETVSVQRAKSNSSVETGSAFNVSCNLTNYSDSANYSSSISNVKIGGETYTFYCASLEIAGVRSVSVLGFPPVGFMHLVHRQNKLDVVMLVLMLICVCLVSLFIVLLILRAARTEVHLCAALIKQMEATQQAERKSMNKSIAFARASHDVRTALASIIGLIELCRYEVSPESEMETNLIQMDTCAANLLDILNSVLDTSKIEAGKMQLEEVEFDLAEVLEEIVDMFYVVGSKKGLEVLLDLCDGSVVKFSHVKGDCGRLKQVLCNLINNAVKFTSEGHIVLRAWARKPSSENSILHSNNDGDFSNLSRCISQWVCKNDDAYNDLSFHMVQQSPDKVEFIFEVDDTGKGIPKEKQNSVFENFVQVKEANAKEHEGTGLGLGIVQSLVRLMGGEIGIVDKEFGEKGTCFKFNIILRTCENVSFSIAEGERVDLLADQVPYDSHQASRSRQASSSSTRDQSPRLNIPIPSCVRSVSKGMKQESIYAVLLIQGDEGRRIAKRWMESNGIKVWALSQWDQFGPVLDKIKNGFLCNNSDGSGQLEPASVNSSNSPSYRVQKEGSTTARDGPHHSLPLKIRTGSRSSSSCILIITDIGCGHFLETGSMLTNFSNSTIEARCKFVWLVNADTPSINIRKLRNRQYPCDLILQKPFHGSRLSSVLRLVGECGGTSEGHPLEKRPAGRGKGPLVSEQGPSTKPGDKASNSVDLESSDKPLSGINVLVAEDNPVLRRLATSILTRLGATAETVENGEEAIILVCEALRATTKSRPDRRKLEASKSFPYDIILMDCEMPIMNGFEATQQIRREERHYGMHIPIIALTAHALAEEAKKCLEAGMDYHLVKPLTPNRLMEAIHSVSNK